MPRFTGHDDYPVVELDDGTYARWNKISLTYERIPSPESAQNSVTWGDVADVIALVVGLTVGVIMLFTG